MFKKEPRKSSQNSAMSAPYPQGTPNHPLPNGNHGQQPIITETISKKGAYTVPQNSQQVVEFSYQEVSKNALQRNGSMQQQDQILDALSQAKRRELDDDDAHSMMQAAVNSPSLSTPNALPLSNSGSANLHKNTPNPMKNQPHQQNPIKAKVLMPNMPAYPMLTHVHKVTTDPKINICPCGVNTSPCAVNTSPCSVNPNPCVVNTPQPAVCCQPNLCPMPQNPIQYGVVPMHSHYGLPHPSQFCISDCKDNRTGYHQYEQNRITITELYPNCENTTSTSVMQHCTSDNCGSNNVESPNRRFISESEPGSSPFPTPDKNDTFLLDPPPSMMNDDNKSIYNQGSILNDPLTPFSQMSLQTDPHSQRYSQVSSIMEDPTDTHSNASPPTSPTTPKSILLDPPTKKTPEAELYRPQKRTPSVVPHEPFNARQDAEGLRRAMKGFGTDEKAVINIIANRTNIQRLEISEQYKTMYGKDLVKDLKSELSGRFEDLIIALMIPLPQFYARELHSAIEGLGTNEDTLIEVLCTMTNSEIKKIKNAYKTVYGHELEEDINSDTSGHFNRLMVSLCNGCRDESYTINVHAAAEDARALLRAGELRFGTDESMFNSILCNRNYPQLKQIFQEYQNITGHEFEKAIKNEFSGDVKDGLLAIVKSVRNKAAYFAERLHDSMAGVGTKDSQLIRIIVTRCEIDMGEIKQAFEARYGKTLEHFISNDTSGNYKKCLLNLIS